MALQAIAICNEESCPAVSVATQWMRRQKMRGLQVLATERGGRRIFQGQPARNTRNDNRHYYAGSPKARDVLSKSHLFAF